MSGRRETVWDGFVDWSGKIGAAGSAKLFAAIVTYPHEVVRTRLRQRPDNGQAKYTGLVQCFKTIWKEEGLVSMYGGLSPHLVGFSLYKQPELLLTWNLAPSCTLSRYHVWHVRDDLATGW